VYSIRCATLAHPDNLATLRLAALAHSGALTDIIQARALICSLVLVHKAYGVEQSCGCMWFTVWPCLRRYRPPEVVLSADSASTCVVTASADLWALGCTLTELITGQPLLPANDESHWASLHAAMGEGARGRVPPGAVQDEAAFINALLNDEPRVRQDVQTLRALPWVSGVADGTLPMSSSTVDLSDIEAAKDAGDILRLLPGEAQPHDKDKVKINASSTIDT
jgi:serine/threonine protein kinase